MTPALPLLFAACLWTVGIGAQDPPIDAQKAEVLRLEAELEAAQAKAGKLGKPAPGVVTTAPRPTPRETKGVRAGAVRLEGSCTPKKVLPGGTGSITVLMALIGDSVLLDPPPMTFQTLARQDAIQLGTPVFRAVKSAGLAPALKGLPAFDDYAIFDVPFAVDATARPALYPVKLAFTYTLHNGKTGGTHEPYTDEIEVEVSVQLAPPAVPEAGSGAHPALRGSSDQMPNPAAATDGKAPGNLVAAAADIPVAGDPPPSAHGGPEVARDEQAQQLDVDGGNLTAVAFAAFAAVAVIAIMLRRRR